jgi:hypothetical protein
MKKFLLLFLCALPAEAATTVGIGAVAQNMGKVTTSADASKSLTGSTYLPELSVGWRIQSGAMGFYPSLGLTILAKKSPEGGQKKSIYTLALPAIFAAGANLELKAGPALQIYSIKGSGGTSEQNNGSSTATFYLPSGSVSSRVFYLDLGLAWLSKQIRGDLDFLITAPKKFSITGIARLSYAFL